MNNTDSQKGLIIKIIVPVLIIGAIAAIWLLKNNRAPSVNDNDDFALEATEVDLEKWKSYGLPIIIDFGADDCPPCREMAPTIKRLHTELKGKVIIKYLDVWKNQNAAANFPVEVIPTLFFFDKDGNPYVPSDPEGMQMRMYSARDTNEHIYTARQGILTEAQIKEVLKEMGFSEDD